MPLLGTANYIRSWVREFNTQSISAATCIPQFPLKECLAALEALGVRTDYDLLLQSDILEQTPAALHAHIRQLRMAVLKHFAAPGHTASSLLKDKDSGSSQNMFIKSGIQELDLLLGGGVCVSQITEFCGNEGSGKTSIVMEFVATHLVPDPSLTNPNCTGVLPSKKVYFAHSSPLPMWRVEQCVKRRLGLYPVELRGSMFREAMDRLVIVDCSDMDSLLTFLYKYADARNSLNREQLTSASVDLLIIDCIRPLVIDVIQLEGDASVAMYAVRSALRAIVCLQAPALTAVILTNGVSQRNDFQYSAVKTPLSYEQLAATRIQPSLGPAWALVSHLSVYLKQAEQNNGATGPSANCSGSGSGSGNGSSQGRSKITAVILKSPRASSLATSEFYLPH
ncbi:DNA repair protein rad51d [Coemansia sp. Benny D115]|nr:DNA repair protein rad51d [Coemansia sp. Benny D115]